MKKVLVLALSLFSVLFLGLSQEQKYVDYYDAEKTILRVEGMYVRGIEHGVWKTYYEDGTLQEEVNYFMGKLNGSVKRFHENGNTLLEQYFKDNKLDSVSYRYYPSGEKRSIGNYADNRKIGSWKYFYLNGNLRLEEEFQDSTRLLLTFNDIDSDSEYFVKNGSGTFVSYHPNGSFLEKIEYLDGIDHGVYEKFNVNGNVSVKGQSDRKSVV